MKSQIEQVKDRIASLEQSNQPSDLKKLSFYKGELLKLEKQEEETKEPVQEEEKPKPKPKAKPKKKK